MFNIVAFMASSTVGGVILLTVVASHHQHAVKYWNELIVKNLRYVLVTYSPSVRAFAIIVCAPSCTCSVLFCFDFFSLETYVLCCTVRERYFLRNGRWWCCLFQQSGWNVNSDLSYIGELHQPHLQPRVNNQNRHRQKMQLLIVLVIAIVASASAFAPRATTRAQSAIVRNQHHWILT